MKLVKDIDNKENSKKVSDKEAEEAFKTILSWMGEDPNREGLLETPKRVVKALTTLLGVSNKPSLLGSSPIQDSIVLKASSASLSETFFEFSLLSISLTNFMGSFIPINMYF